MEALALRTEHLLNDWNATDILLGGDESINFQQRNYFRDDKGRKGRGTSKPVLRVVDRNPNIQEASSHGCESEARRSRSEYC
jgi:hypothetical protein